MTMRVEVDLESANGPKVVADKAASPEAILAQLPAGWTVHDDDWGNGVDVGGGRMAYPLSQPAADVR